MLILTRRAGQSIRIGDDITVHVMSEQGGQIRLGIEAPTHIRVDREEIYEKRRRETQETRDD